MAIESHQTGLIYNVDFPRDLETGKLYLGVYHGRNLPDELLNDWGFNGPILGPFIRYTVNDFKTIVLTAEDGTEISLPMVDDMVQINGKYYGDWSIFCPGVSSLPVQQDAICPVAKVAFDGSGLDELPCGLYLDAKDIYPGGQVLRKRSLIGPVLGIHTTYAYHIRLHVPVKDEPWVDFNFDNDHLMNGKFNRIELFYKP